MYNRNITYENLPRYNNNTYSLTCDYLFTTYLACEYVHKKYLKNKKRGKERFHLLANLTSNFLIFMHKHNEPKHKCKGKGGLHFVELTFGK